MNSVIRAKSHLKFLCTEAILVKMIQVDNEILCVSKVVSFSEFWRESGTNKIGKLFLLDLVLFLINISNNS